MAASNVQKFGNRLVDCKHVHTNSTDLSSKQDLIPASTGKSIVLCDIIIRGIAIDITLFDGTGDAFYKFITPAGTSPDVDSASGTLRAPIMLTEGNSLKVQAGNTDVNNSITLTYYYI